MMHRKSAFLNERQDCCIFACRIDLKDGTVAYSEGGGQLALPALQHLDHGNRVARNAPKGKEKRWEKTRCHSFLTHLSFPTLVIP